jgi:hypothetical protein
MNRVFKVLQLLAAIRAIIGIEAITESQILLGEKLVLQFSELLPVCDRTIEPST